MRSGSPITCLFLGFLSLASSIHAQVAISGRIVDETGAAVSGVRVEMRSGNAAAAVASSDPAGNFNLNPGAAGEYEVRAERQGFYRQRGIEVQIQLMTPVQIAAGQIADQVQYGTGYLQAVRAGGPLRIVSAQVVGPIFTVMARPSASRIARSIVFSSSRMLPGQL